jgi:hypothetical protein
MIRSSVKGGMFAALLFVSAGQALLAQESAGSLPVRRVVLFSSGVGFYEHTAEVRGNASIDLKFNVEDVNDLLKSMVLMDEGGGRISTVNYGSKDPITKTLKTFAIDLTANPTLADLLSQVRGERVEVDAPNAIAGIIVGVEKRKKQIKEEVVEEEFLNLLTDDGLRSVPLASMGRIKLANDKLDGELRQALAILALGHATDKKTVTLNFMGEGARRVRVGYIQESPIWKTSYRLVLDDEDAPFLQGWAIVENTTEEDWKDVALTLVSGRPISFVMNLYDPLYIRRPVVEPELFASLRPQTYGQDLAGAEAEFRKLAEGGAAPPGAPPPAAAESLDRGLRRGRASGAMPGGGGGFGGVEQERKFDLASTGQSMAQAGDVGELFQYAIETPVTLPRQQSAMLTIVNGSVQGEKVSIYNQSVQARHPLSGLKLKNTTGLHLMQGPITVFDGGAYAGDAQIHDLQPDSERLISYALDLDTEVVPETKGYPDVLSSVKITKGVMETRTKLARSTSFTVKNSGRKAKPVLVEYPIEPGWDLVTPKEPTEKSRDVYRFSVAAEPGKPASLEIKEERTTRQEFAVNNLDEANIRYYLAAPVVSTKVKEALTEVIRRKAAIQVLATKRAQLSGQIQAIDQEQNRIRQNMAQLDKTNELYSRYVKKLTQQEDEVDKLKQDVASTLAEETRLIQELDKYLIELNLE